MESEREIHAYKIMCLMTIGAPLTQQVSDVLLLNAVDMWNERQHTQMIASRSYDGVIKSNLEVFEHFGVPVVLFEAMVSTEKFRSVEVRYVVRIDDLEHMDPGEWARIMIGSEGPLPPPLLPLSNQEEIPQNPEWN